MKNIIKLPDNLFTPTKGKVVIYALDTATIGITPSFEYDWAKNCIYHRGLNVRKQGNNWLVTLPYTLTQHYRLGGGKKTVVSINGGRVLITVT